MPATSSSPPAATIGFVESLRSDRLTGLSRAAKEYDGIVHVPTDPPFILITDPAYAHIILSRHNQFIKKIDKQPASQRLFGLGILTSNGAWWLHERKVMVPPFRSESVRAYGKAMSSIADSYVSTWRDGEQRELVADMKQLTLTIAVRVLFGVNREVDAARITQALDTVVGSDIRAIRSQRPATTDKDDEVESALSYLKEFVDALVRDREQEGAASDGDLLLTLLTAQRQGKISRQQLHDEVANMIAAGHETTALSLSWTWQLLATHPRVQDRLAEEIDSVLRGGAPDDEQVEHLPFADAVFSEAMRLYPPAYAIGRTAVEDVTVGPYSFPPDTQFTICPWAMHRNPQYFEEPDRFLPRRWLDVPANSIPSYAYLPFGGGPRGCLGARLARNEALILLATTIQRFKLSQPPDAHARPSTLLTLRPDPGVNVTVHRRPGTGTTQVPSD